MPEIKLKTSLDNPELETVLTGLIELVELSFPGRILACYLGGSRSDGTAVLTNGTDPNASDLDVLVVFTGQLSEDEILRFRGMVAACNRFSKTWLDATLTSEEQLKSGAFQMTLLSVLVKLAKVFLYGKDIRPSLELPPLRNYLVWLAANGFYTIGSARQPELPTKSAFNTLPFATPVSYPVTIPKPEIEFGGYDLYVRHLPDGTYQPGYGGLRWLVGHVLWLTAFRLAYNHGIYTATKRETVQKYGELIHDEWTDLVQEIFEYGKLKWLYVVPPDPTERAKLVGLCQHLPAYENQFLEDAQDFLLQLVNEGVSEELKPLVCETLRMINLPNPAFQSWLFQNTPDKK
ncbi:MAG: nucleotidyltransferase domain-containing protein [Chloroflexi bacterium]|nr:nucleotidyltransferase domain-containing protein [Chloroflexota bacterium]OJW05522.1 MAG: hypothetical protein BGO39_08855 [Chloroflexi bacterium 54-19]